VTVAVLREGARTLDADWERKLAAWNAGHPNHPPVLVRWEPRAFKRSYMHWVNGVPVKRWRYEPRWQVGVVLPFVPKGMKKFAVYLDGSGGQWFIRLFDWQMQDGTFLDVDDRIFTLLQKGDMTQYRHFARTVEEPEAQAEAKEKQQLRADVGDTLSHYRNFHNPTVSLDPTVKVGGDWRYKVR
jgi:hypothetical protein